MEGKGSPLEWKVSEQQTWDWELGPTFLILSYCLYCFLNFFLFFLLLLHYRSEFSDSLHVLCWQKLLGLGAKLLSASLILSSPSHSKAGTRQYLHWLDSLPSKQQFFFPFSLGNCFVLLWLKGISGTYQHTQSLHSSLNLAFCVICWFSSALARWSLFVPFSRILA